MKRKRWPEDGLTDLNRPYLEAFRTAVKRGDDWTAAWQKAREMGVPDWHLEAVLDRQADRED